MKWLKGDVFFCKCQVNVFLWDALEMKVLKSSSKVVAFGGQGMWAFDGLFGGVFLVCVVLLVSDVSYSIWARQNACKKNNI